MIPFWQNWLRIASLVLVANGVLAALTILPAVGEIMRSLLGTLFVTPIDPQPAFGPYLVLVTGISGAITMAWGVMIYVLATDGFNSDAPWVYKALSASLVIWFVVDNVVSWEVGAAYNIIGNCIYATVFALPLIFGRKSPAAARQSA